MNDSVKAIKYLKIIKKPKKDPKNEKNNRFRYYNIARYLIFLSFIFLGFINHLGYYLIITSSQQFATKLENESLIACYPLALIVFSCFTRLLNSKYFINISYYIRIIILSVYFFIGYIALFFILGSSKVKNNKNLAFWLTMIPTTIVGTGESFGEVTILGFAGTLKGNFISGWNIGAAIAGVCGTFLSLLFKKLNTNLKYVYLFLSPVSILYLFIFMLTNLCQYKEIKIINKKKFHKFHEQKVQKNNEIYISEANDNKVLNIKNFVEGFRMAYKYIINLTLINFLQYTICYCFCERANKYKFINSKRTFFEKIQYEAFLLFFELGVVVSNSFIILIRNIKHLEIFTYLQFLNFFLWFFESLSGFISNQWICYMHLFFVGICGGGANIGFLYEMFNSKIIPQKYKELCFNICEFFMDWGILISSVTSIIFDNTFMKAE